MWRAFCFLATALAAASQTPPVPDGAIQRFASGYKFVSALVWSRDGFLAVGDSGASRIVRIDHKGPSVLHDKVPARGLAIDSRGDLYVCDASARNVVRIGKNGPEILAAEWEGKRLNGPRDLVVTRNGTVFFTDPAFASADLKREQPLYGIYRVTSKGELTSVAQMKTRPNGLALSPDGSVLYATLADERSVVAWTLDKNGAASGLRTVLSNVPGVPDAIEVGPDGNIYIAARNVEVYAPDGRHISTHTFSGKVTSLAFGEPDLHTLFAGTGGTIYRMRLAIAPKAKGDSN